MGDGWSALGCVGFLAKQGKPIVWIPATGARFLPALPTLESGFEQKGALAWQSLANLFQIETGSLQTGSYLREFRNKAFREPLWMKAPTPMERKEVLEESLWGPEQRLVPIFESRFASITPAEIEEQIRAQLISEEFPNVRRIEGAPLNKIVYEADADKKGQEKVHSVILGSGEEIACEQIFYADKWDNLGEIQGIPKPIPFLRYRHGHTPGQHSGHKHPKHESMGVFQAVFNHEKPMAVGLQEGFLGSLHRESGEENDRHVWGYFTSEGQRSVWTICLSPEEAEDNHLIMKRLRRMKSTLDKMFQGSAWLPEGKADFMSTVLPGESVRFHEAVILSGGEALTSPQSLPHHTGISFLTDGYGPSIALLQAATATGIELGGLDPSRSETETETVDTGSTLSS
jgi:hypothetical protein